MYIYVFPTLNYTVLDDSIQVGDLINVSTSVRSSPAHWLARTERCALLWTRRVELNRRVELKRRIELDRRIQ